MKFSVLRDEFHQAISAAQRATSPRVIQPILGNFLIQAIGTDTLRISATDLDFSIQTDVPATITEAGDTTISAKKLTEIFSKLQPGTTISFEIEPKLQSAHIESGASHFDIRTMPAEEYPVIPQVDATDSSLSCLLEVPAARLVKAIQQTAFAAASQESNNVLSGVFFKALPGALELAATDGSRLTRTIERSVADCKLNNGQTEFSAIVPARAMQELMKLVGLHPSEEEIIQLAFQNGQIFLKTSKYRIVSRLLDGQYPRYEQLIPAENQIQAKANRLELLAALERAAVMANERTNVVKMIIESNHMGITADTPDMGGARDMVSIQYGGETFQIAFNYKYLLDALKVIDSDDVRLETNGPLLPTLLKANHLPADGNGNGNDAISDYLCLVMPVQVK